MSLIVHHNIETVKNTFHIQQWNYRNRDHDRNTTVKQHHERVLNLEDEIVQSFTFEQYHWYYERQNENTDWEKCDSDTTADRVIAGAILKPNNVHSSQSSKVLVDKLVPVDEHSNQETKQQNIEYIHENGYKYFSLRILVVPEMLFAIKTIKYVQNNLKE